MSLDEVKAAIEQLPHPDLTPTDYPQGWKPRNLEESEGVISV